MEGDGLNRTLAGVACRVKSFCGDVETFFVGDDLAGEALDKDVLLITGLSNMAKPSTGAKDTLLLARRVDLWRICFSLAFRGLCCASAVSMLVEGGSNSRRGCSLAIMVVSIFVVGSMGQRELCRFLGTQLRFSCENVACRCENGGVLVSVCSSSMAATDAARVSAL